MKKLALVTLAMVVTFSSTAHAGFFDTMNKVGQVAEAVTQTQESLAEGRLEVPAAVMKQGGGKHGGGSHGKHHK